MPFLVRIGERENCGGVVDLSCTVGYINKQHGNACGLKKKFLDLPSSSFLRQNPKRCSTNPPPTSRTAPPPRPPSSLPPPHVQKVSNPLSRYNSYANSSTTRYLYSCGLSLKLSLSDEYSARRSPHSKQSTTRWKNTRLHPPPFPPSYPS